MKQLMFYHLRGGFFKGLVLKRLYFFLLIMISIFMDCTQTNAAKFNETDFYCYGAVDMPAPYSYFKQDSLIEDNDSLLSSSVFPFILSMKHERKLPSKNWETPSDSLFYLKIIDLLKGDILEFQPTYDSIYEKKYPGRIANYRFTFGNPLLLPDSRSNDLCRLIMGKIGIENLSFNFMPEDQHREKWFFDFTGGGNYGNRSNVVTISRFSDSSLIIGCRTDITLGKDIQINISWRSLQPGNFSVSTYPGRVDQIRFISPSNGKVITRFDFSDEESRSKSITRKILFKKILRQ